MLFIGDSSHSSSICAPGSVLASYISIDILISAPKQYIFNFLNEIKNLEQTSNSAGHDIAFLC